MGRKAYSLELKESTNAQLERYTMTVLSNYHGPFECASIERSLQRDHITVNVSRYNGLKSKLLICTKYRRGEYVIVLIKNG